MRPHGSASINANSPRTLAVCDRCGFLYNHGDLSWQFQWRGTKLQNIRQLVCQSCNDKPQEQLRVIVLPPDPVPIMNARPENYVDADNPLSVVGVSANFAKPAYGSRVGNMTADGGLNAAFDGNPVKVATACAGISISNSSYNNYVGINWNGMNLNTISVPSGLIPTARTHTLTSYTITAPVNAAIGSTSYLVQGSYVNATIYGAWTTVSSGSIAGTVGEVITGTVTTGGSYPFHRVAFYGSVTPNSFNNDFNSDFAIQDLQNQISVSQVAFDVAETG